MSEPLSNRLHELRNVCCTSQRTLQDQKRPNGLTATSVAGQVVSVALHDRLEELCRRLGVKPTKLGVDAGLSTYTVNNWIKKSKSGKPLPGRTRELEQLARHYGYDVSWFTEAQPERRPGDLPESFGVSVAVVDQVARDLQADGVSYEQAIRAILAVADSGAPNDLLSLRRAAKQALRSEERRVGKAERRARCPSQR